jgi:hypothetical protein
MIKRGIKPCLLEEQYVSLRTNGYSTRIHYTHRCRSKTLVSSEYNRQTSTSNEWILNKDPLHLSRIQASNKRKLIRRYEGFEVAGCSSLINVFCFLFPTTSWPTDLSTLISLFIRTNLFITIFVSFQFSCYDFFFGLSFVRPKSKLTSIVFHAVDPIFRPHSTLVLRTHTQIPLYALSLPHLSLKFNHSLKLTPKTTLTILSGNKKSSLKPFLLHVSSSNSLTF